MQVRDLIADVKQSLRKKNLDDRIPNSFVYSKLIKHTALLIKRESDSRRIFRQTNLFKPKVFELESYQGMRRSMEEIPDFFTTSYGNLLLVGSDDYTNAYKQISPEKLSQTKTREFQNPNKKYYWIENNRLVIPDGYMEDVLVRGLFYNYTDYPCQPLLDTEFPCPDYLLEEVVNMSVQSLTVREKITPDENPNLDSNNK